MRKIAPTPARLPAPAGHGAQAPAAALSSAPTVRARRNHPFAPERLSDRTGPYFQTSMGTVLAIANQKGGVGKTTTAVNLGASIADAGYPTLLVDLDPQCNATVALGLPKDGEPERLRLPLSGELTLAAAALPSGIDELDVVPVHARPRRRQRRAAPHRRLGDASCATGSASVRDRYLFTLLDCPPSLGPLTVNALVAADQVIVPVQTEYFALEGLAQLLDTLSLIQRELNPRLTVSGMILTMHDGRTRLARDVEREVREHFPELVFDTVVPRNVRLGEAPSFGLPVLRHAPHSAGSARRT